MRTYVHNEYKYIQNNKNSLLISVHYIHLKDTTFKTKSTRFICLMKSRYMCNATDCPTAAPF